MDCADLMAFEDGDEIEPCRACGIYFLLNHSIIRPIFTKPDAGDNFNGQMSDIVQQMSDWNLQVLQNDGRPQYMCKSCILEFQKVLQFKRSCLETQQQFDTLEYTRAHNGVIIKKEIQTEQTFCGFVYLDTDDEEGSEEDGSTRVCAPLDIPHVPIKMEHAARVPLEAPPIQPPASNVASDLPEEATFAKIEPKELAVANGVSSTIFEADAAEDDSQESDDEIIKFTYDDHSDEEELTTLPAPIQEPGVFCKLCGHESLSQVGHTEHMSRIHMLKDCECHICGKKFVNAPESRLRFHMKWHKLQKHLKCPICGFFCNSKDTLKQHKLAVHTRTKCEYCGKVLKHQQLQAHLNRHIEESER
ncbi:zinc finger protein 420 isoform X2 [Drosophila nasuta]|uniref:zinc finger protein 420 isoform X2 n=1 Tax=Drosophila nasuta TaxID=42062 RepID=UPI00295EEFE7|nr:zinc finger protein 420 isoform X2 [Drosophila nasuta]